MAENRVEANAHNAGGCPASNAIHGHINDFLVRTGLRSGVSELQLPCFTAVRAEIALMSGSAFAVTHHPVSSWTGGTADRNRSHWSTSKTPSYTKSVSWQHHQLLVKLSPIYLLYNVTLPPSHHRSRMTRYQESKIIACEKLYIRKIILQKHCSSIDRKRTMDQNNILTIKTQAR